MKIALGKVLNRISTIKKKNEKLFLLSVSTLIILSVALITYLILINNSSKKVEQGYSVTKLESGTPDYKTILPNGKTIEDLGGWTKISPSNASPVYTFVDKIDNIPIKVSEQPLPDEFKNDTKNQVEEMAKSFGANEMIKIDNIFMYIGISAEGYQSIILTKNDLLILIKSEAKISNDKWVNYVRSLN